MGSAVQRQALSRHMAHNEDEDYEFAPRLAP